MLTFKGFTGSKKEHGRDIVLSNVVSRLQVEIDPANYDNVYITSFRSGERAEVESVISTYGNVHVVSANDPRVKEIVEGATKKNIEEVNSSASFNYDNPNGWRREQEDMTWDSWRD